MQSAVARNIASLREARGWKNAEFADLLGVRQPVAWKLEHMAGVPNTLTLLRIAKLLRVSVDRLLVGLDTTYDEIANSVKSASSHDSVVLASRLESLERENATLRGIIDRAFDISKELADVTAHRAESRAVAQPEPRSGGHRRTRPR